MKHCLLIASVLLTTGSVSAQTPIEVQQVSEVSIQPRSYSMPQSQMHRDMLLDARPNPTAQVVAMVIGGVFVLAGAGSMISGAISNSTVNFSPSRGHAVLPPGYGALVAGGFTASLGLITLLGSAIHFAVKRKRMRAIDKELRQLNLSLTPTGFQLSF